MTTFKKKIVFTISTFLLFLLVLIGVDAPTNDRIINWFEQGRRTGSYPGMTWSTVIPRSASPARCAPAASSVPSGVNVPRWSS